VPGTPKPACELPDTPNARTAANGDCHGNNTPFEVLRIHRRPLELYSTLATAAPGSGMEGPRAAYLAELGPGTGPPEATPSRLHKWI
jgi:hypothetical protein